MTSEQISACILRKRLKPLMKARGITYKVLGEKSGVPVKTLYGWSAGSSPRCLSDVYEVAKVLGVSVEELCFSSDASGGNFDKAFMQKPEKRMLKDIEPMNEELSACLKNASNKASHEMADVQVIFDRPVLVPCYLLFAIAKELGVAKEIYEIIASYEWEFGIRKS